MTAWARGSLCRLNAFYQCNYTQHTVVREQNRLLSTAPSQCPFQAMSSLRWQSKDNFTREETKKRKHFYGLYISLIYLASIHIHVLIWMCLLTLPKHWLMKDCWFISSISSLLWMSEFEKKSAAIVCHLTIFAAGWHFCLSAQQAASGSFAKVLSHPSVSFVQITLILCARCCAEVFYSTQCYTHSNTLTCGCPYAHTSWDAISPHSHTLSPGSWNFFFQS